MNGNTEDDADRHVPLIAKHPPVRLNPTLDVDVAWPEMFRPDSVVVPNPIDDTESCVAVDEPTTKPIVSPAIGLTDRRPNGVVDEIPTLPLLKFPSVNILLNVPDPSVTLKSPARTFSCDMPGL